MSQPSFELNVCKMRHYCFNPGEPASADSPLISVIEATPDDGPFLRGNPPEFDLEAWEKAHFYVLFSDRESFRKAWRSARIHLVVKGFGRIRTGDMIGELGQIAI